MKMCTSSFGEEEIKFDGSFLFFFNFVFYRCFRDDQCLVTIDGGGGGGGRREGHHTQFSSLLVLLL